MNSPVPAWNNIAYSKQMGASYDTSREFVKESKALRKYLVKAHGKGIGLMEAMETFTYTTVNDYKTRYIALRNLDEDIENGTVEDCELMKDKQEVVNVIYRLRKKYKNNVSFIDEVIHRRIEDEYIH